MDKKDETILMLADRLFICSRLLTCAAERLSWDSEAVQELILQLRIQTALVQAEVEIHAGIKEDSGSK